MAGFANKRESANAMSRHLHPAHTELADIAFNMHHAKFRFCKIFDFKF